YWIRANTDATFELIFKDRAGKITNLTGSQPRLAANKPRIGKPQKWPEASRRTLTVYAYSVKALGGATFPSGQRISTGGLFERFLHPLYKLDAAGAVNLVPDPAKMVKITVPLIVVDRPGKPPDDAPE